MDLDRRFTIAFLIVFALARALAAQSPQTADLQTPTFKVQVDYVAVDVVVTDQEGRIVRGLTKDDFQLYEDDRPQSIDSFAVVDIPIERLDRPLFAAEPIEPDVRTNERPFNGRVYVMILDRYHTSILRTQRVKDAARQFIEQHLGANDVMAIVQTSGRTDAGQEFTSSKRLLLASVDKFVGRKLPSPTFARNTEFFLTFGRGQGTVGGAVADPYDLERAYNARSALRTVKNVAESIGGVRGRRKTILFVSEGIDYDITDIIRVMDGPGSSGGTILADIRETITATARSNVSIYSIDPRGLTTANEDTIGVRSFADQHRYGANSELNTGDRGSARPTIGTMGLGALMNEQQVSQDSLRTLAGETGGFAAINSNDFATAFDRIVTNNSSYYVLAYYPQPAKRDDKFHRIEVRVSRPGLTVRARRGYVAPKGNRPVPRAASNDGASPEVLEILNSPLQVSGLGMRVFASPFRSSPPNAVVVLGVELLGRDLALPEGGKIELSFVAVDGSGEIRAGTTDHLTLNLRPDTRARAQQGWLRFLDRFTVPPGRYQVRIASHDVTGGRVGSVLYDLDVPDFNRLPFSMSGLLLTSATASRSVTVRPDEQLREVLPAPPVAMRTFPQNDELALFTEVYERAGAPPHRVDIVTTVKAVDGTVLFRHQEERSSSELDGKSGGYGHSVRFRLHDFRPGAYVLTVEAQSRVGQTASRQLQFTVTPVQQ